jgi:serine/threonine protein kinase
LNWQNLLIMTPERHQQLKRLFLAAVELSPTDAESFLDAACGADAIFRAEAGALLAAHNQDTLLPRDTGLMDEANSSGIMHAKASVPAGPPEDLHELGEPRIAGTIVAGRYRIVGELGRGGLGVVYRAEDLELHETIALKFLHPRLQRLDQAMDLLREEVRVARQVSHPNVIRVFDFGVGIDEVFISMEYVAGEDLASLVRRVGRLPSEKLLQVARQIADGLAAAHDSGILHRDLKPSNVMLDGNGNVRILDFGIAAVIGQAVAKPSAGTPGFLAPELLLGSAPSVQSDLYAWGLVVYYAATGRLPTENTANGFPPAVEDLRGSSVVLHGPALGLASWVQTCLNPDPALRPRSAREIVVGLS